jgi:hypothetical protein
MPKRESPFVVKLRFILRTLPRDASWRSHASHPSIPSLRLKRRRVPEEAQKKQFPHVIGIRYRYYKILQYREGFEIRDPISPGRKGGASELFGTLQSAEVYNIYWGCGAIGIVPSDGVKGALGCRHAA